MKFGRSLPDELADSGGVDMRFESYAQFLEDLILHCALKDVDKGFYIDVGANDPTADSVTKFFYDKGWYGINIEPLADKCALLAEMRPRDVNLCVGLGSERGKLEMFEADGLSTFLEDIAKSVNIDKSNKRTKNILTLSEVYEHYAPPQSTVHFCKIDVEGYERKVLEGIKDWQKFRPWIFCMESTLPMTNIPCHEQWEDLLLANDYVFAFQLSINRYYVAAEREHLLNNFQQINRFVAQNQIVKMNMVPIVFK